MDRWFTDCWSGRAVLLTLLLIACVYGQTEPVDDLAADPDEAAGVRFVALDVMMDSGEDELAAYQFELNADSKQVRIVGVEGGDHTAFREPPFYDPAALSQNRIIVAAFSTARTLPNGKHRVARIHLQIEADIDPDYTTKLITAASRDGQNISPEITVASARERATQGEAR